MCALSSARTVKPSQEIRAQGKANLQLLDDMIALRDFRRGSTRLLFQFCVADAKGLALMQALLRLSFGRVNQLHLLLRHNILSKRCRLQAPDGDLHFMIA